MKNYLKVLILPVLFFIFSGCNESEKSENKEEAVVAEGWLTLDLNQPGVHYSLPLLINIPDENLAKGLSEIMEGPTGGTQIKAGRDFNLEISPAPLSIAEKKEEIENNKVFKITYITDEPDAILYKSEIENTDIAQFHFYSIRKIGDLQYGIEDIKDDDYSQNGIQRMMEAAKSLRENK